MEMMLWCVRSLLLHRRNLYGTFPVSFQSWNTPACLRPAVPLYCSLSWRRNYEDARCCILASLRSTKCPRNATFLMCLCFTTGEVLSLAWPAASTATLPQWVARDAGHRRSSCGPEALSAASTHNPGVWMTVSSTRARRRRDTRLLDSRLPGQSWYGQSDWVHCNTAGTMNTLKLNQRRLCTATSCEGRALDRNFPQGPSDRAGRRSVKTYVEGRAAQARRPVREGIGLEIESEGQGKLNGKGKCKYCGKQSKPSEAKS